jgi:hypothetical protein
MLIQLTASTYPIARPPPSPLPQRIATKVELLEVGVDGQRG